MMPVCEDYFIWVTLDSMVMFAELIGFVDLNMSEMTFSKIGLSPGLNR